MRTALCLALFVLFFLPNLLSQELEIFNLTKYPEENGFISLTDHYPFYEHEDSSVIEKKYLGYIDIEDKGYHLLNSENRVAFLKRINISNHHKLFIYNYLLDTLLTYDVRDLNLIAILDPYIYKAPIPSPHYYMIGFEISKKEIEKLGAYYHFSFVYIGEQNPFETGGLKSMTWEQISDTLQFNYAGQEDKFQKYSKGEAYKFESDRYSYFLQNLYFNERLKAGQLAVINSATDSLVFNMVYSEGESTGLRGIRLSGEKSEYPIVQRTGKLFKNKPPVVFGFLHHSFGCPQINFLSLKEEPIVIRCDNRH